MFTENECMRDKLTLFCETRSKRSVEAYKGKNLDPPTPAPTDVTDIFNWHLIGITDVTDIFNWYLIGI